MTNTLKTLPHYTNHTIKSILSFIGMPSNLLSCIDILNLCLPLNIVRDLFFSLRLRGPMNTFRQNFVCQVDGLLYGSVNSVSHFHMIHIMLKTI